MIAIQYNTKYVKPNGLVMDSYSCVLFIKIVDIIYEFLDVNDFYILLLIYAFVDQCLMIINAFLDNFLYIKQSFFIDEAASFW